MFYYSDDPVRDAERHMAEQDRQRERYPKCSHCGEEIQDDELFDIHGEVYHLSCAEKEFVKWTEDYIE